MKNQANVCANPKNEGTQTPILYYVFLTPQEVTSQKQVIAKFEARGWKFLKRSISRTTHKIGLVFQRQSLMWETHSYPSIFHPFQVFHP